MFERAALVHYHEIGLKGRNRATFERRLAGNIAEAVGDIPIGRIDRVSSRLLVEVPDPRDADAVMSAISRLPGVAHVSDAYVISREPADMERAALLAVADFGPARTFAIDARRSSTDHAETSLEMNVRVGDAVRVASGMTVDLGAPEMTVRIEVVQGAAYVYTRRLMGPGGLPVGVSGRVVSLLSSGIDSPVATWRLMKRGAVVIGVHFSGVPHTSDASQRLVHEIAEVLEPVGGIGRIHVVPFGELQKEISLKAAPDLRILLYRRLMFRVAERIARDEGAKALVTGESLGQVASQTLENIASVDAVATMPVLRPLIGTDKQEIVAEAKAIGTFETSIQQQADCCTLFMPRTPATHATPEECAAAEVGLDIDRMVADALAGATHRDYRCAAYRSKR